MPLILSTEIKTSILSPSLRALKKERSLIWTIVQVDVDAVFYDIHSGTPRLVIDSTHTTSGATLRTYMYMCNDPNSTPIINEAYVENNNTSVMFVHIISVQVAEFKNIWLYLKANNLISTDAEPAFTPCNFNAISEFHARLLHILVRYGYAARQWLRFVAAV